MSLTLTKLSIEKLRKNEKPRDNEEEKKKKKKKKSQLALFDE